MTAQHGPVAPGDARHRAHRARASRARRIVKRRRPDRLPAPLLREGSRSTRPGRRSSRTPIASTTSRRCSTTSATRWRSRSCWASPSEIPERAQYIRVIVGEMSRITDHLTCLGAGAMELGAFTVFLYALKAREWLCELLEEVSRRAADATATCASAASPTTCPHGFADKLRDILARSTQVVLTDIEQAARRATASSATAWTASAIITQGRRARVRLDRPGRLRSTGVAYDVRKDHPYLVYDRFDFDVPVGSTGDNFDRFVVRVEEIAAVDAHPRAGARSRSRPGRSWSTIRASCCRPRARPTTRSRR